MTNAFLPKGTMNEKGQCSQCGATLPADIAADICPQCELRGALNLSVAPSQILSGVATVAGEAPVLATATQSAIPALR